MMRAVFALTERFEKKGLIEWHLGEKLTSVDFDEYSLTFTGESSKRCICPRRVYACDGLWSRFRQEWKAKAGGEIESIPSKMRIRGFYTEPIPESNIDFFGPYIHIRPQAEKA